ncbi:DEAD/DEAH box helicase [Paenibacillus tritici]|uniref:DEAD/DEAH box helicase n=1 Tax=Paenibacillus tritici TaxID=1873425 RepID=A0ABX2DRA1_9BACL|nr:helicase-related protein [Paenibacillus tritici]NQX47187.1 DEAD/DEAH box helicase [Paenibacillus tritici]
MLQKKRRFKANQSQEADGLKVAVYVVEQGGDWEARISLNMAVDQLWWTGRETNVPGWNRQPADRIVLLSRSLPLGWAVKLATACRFTGKMQHWDEAAWSRGAAALLKAEIRAEQAAGGGRGRDWPFEEVEMYRLVGAKGYGGGEEGSVDWGDGRSEWTGEWMNEHGNERTNARVDRRISEKADERVNGRRNERESEWTGGRMYGHGNERTNARVDRREELAAGADRLAEALAGRSLLQGEAEALVAEQLPELAGNWLAAAQLAYLQGRLRLEAAVCGTAGAALGLRRREVLRCLRCGSVPTGRTACAACGLAGCAYCEACLALGRSRACALLLRSAPLPAVRCTAGVAPTVTARRWGLSAAQAAAAAAALGFLAEPRKRSAAGGPERFLLWAVTGAGKTEITFPLLEAALAAGGRALIATPRRDVVLELAPRLAKAFPADVPAVLYGGSEDRWSRSRITLATTHQLLRFNQAFDLVIIDEIDAFPYHNDPMLAYAARQVCKPEGAFIYLSATPPVELQRLARFGRLPHARVPVRFHGYPLPVPRHVQMQPLNRCLKQGRLPKRLLQALQHSIDRKAQIFLFVSRIAHIDGLLLLLRRMYPNLTIEGTSSKDPARAGKVLEFREGTISLLVTTTILERGVTVPHSDVFILDADSGLFDEAALVQMAGRAGRSKDDPAGNVIFASAEWSRSQRAAISQIRRMNAMARRQGYFKS